MVENFKFIRKPKERKGQSQHGVNMREINEFNTFFLYNRKS